MEDGLMGMSKIVYFVLSYSNRSDRFASGYTAVLNIFESSEKVNLCALQMIQSAASL